MSEEAIHFRREPKFVRERFDDIARRGSEYLVKDMLPAQGFGYVAGPSGSLKTFMVLDWCLAITQGAPILGHRTKACGVVYVAAEAPNGVRKRIEAWRQRNTGNGLPFELIGQSPNLRDEAQVGDLAAELRLAREEMANQDHRLGLVVIDTLAASMPGGDENAGVDVSAVLSNVAWLGAEIGAFVLVVSRTGKDETRGLRGWSGQFAGADCVIMLTREEDNPVRVGKVTKLKDGEDGQRFALRLDRVVLGLDDDGDEVSSAVVVYEDAPEGGTDGRILRLNAAAETILAAMGRLEEEGQFQHVPLVPGVKAGTQGARLDHLRRMAFDLGLQKPSEPTDDASETLRRQWIEARKKAFQRGIEKLIEARKVRHEGDWVWLL